MFIDLREKNMDVRNIGWLPPIHALTWDGACNPENGMGECSSQLCHPARWDAVRFK